MKINVEFDSLEEMKDFIDRAYVSAAVSVVPPVKETKEVKKEKTPRVDIPASDTAEHTPVSDNVAAESDNSEAVEPENTGEDTKEYTLTEVRAKFVDLTKKGKQKEVKAILESFGVEKISDLDPSNYAAAMEKAGEL